MVKVEWYNAELQAAFDRGDVETVIIDTSMPPMIDGDQLVREGHDMKIVRDGKIIWHKPGPKLITLD